MAGAEGLTWSRDETPRARRLAALATAFGALASTLREHGADLGEVQLVTLDSRHVVARRLPTWTRGAWLIAESTAVRRAPSRSMPSSPGQPCCDPTAPRARRRGR